MNELKIKVPTHEASALFIPQKEQIGIPSAYIRGISSYARTSIQRFLPEELHVERGRFIFDPHAYDVYAQIGKVVKEIALHRDTVRIPEMKTERLALGEAFADSLIHHKGRLRFVSPVCPDYSRGDQFYQSIGTGVSPEAKAAIDAIKTLSPIFRKSDFQPEYTIIVANTEDDKEDIMKKVVEGDADKYEDSCLGSVNAIKRKLVRVPNMNVQTFTEFLGEDFRHMQYSYEDKIREVMSGDSNFHDEVVRIGEARKTRHSQILGREEQDYELTVRYIAQYAALGSIARQSDVPMILLNYDTPNRRYFNATFNKHPEIALQDKDKRKVIPIMGTVAKR